MIKTKLSIALLTSVLAWGLVPDFSKLKQIEGVYAQEASPNPTFTLQETIPDGTIVKVATTDSMQSIVEAVEGGFTAKYAGSKAEIITEEADAALKNLADGTVDVAAVGRPLTQAEKDQGLVAVPVSRHKIALIVGIDNPFTGSLTIEEFAKIFQGQIKDWSEVKGTAGPIRVVDRPEGSDTRQAFQDYPIFQGNFKTGDNAETVTEDDSEMVIEKLGPDGISYAVYDQVKGNTKVNIIEMDGVSPEDPKYPFSQPLYFVYKGPQASPQVQSFMGYTVAPETATLIEEARLSRYAQATPETSPTTEATTTPEGQEGTGTTETPTEETQEKEENKGGFPWWLLLLPFLGILGWFLLKKGDSEEATETATTETPVVVPPPVPIPVEIPTGRIILTPRSCREAFAYWEVTEARKAQVRGEEGENLVLRIYDVTDIDIDQQAPHSTSEYSVLESENGYHVDIEQDDRDYIAELGYLTADNRFLGIVRSFPVRVPPCEPEELLADTRSVDIPPIVAPLPVMEEEAAIDEMFPVMAEEETAGMDELLSMGDINEEEDEFLGIFEDEDLFSSETAALTEESPNYINLVCRSENEAYVSWRVSEADKENLRQQGGETLILRLYDLTDSNDDGRPDSMWDHECVESDQDRIIPLYQGDRNYMAELGYRTPEGRWLPLIQSDAVYIPPKTSEEG